MDRVEKNDTHSVLNYDTIQAKDMSKRNQKRSKYHNKTSVAVFVYTAMCYVPLLTAMLYQQKP